ncbi:hypothetical protein KQX54_010051 [Cotesia glomerata]|uniref:OTU domain-containing protein n=1 Tax=Cotesia glomerata TaxID=32391 RepID=A0AAV7HT74_COTGL|nr:hypothetical protein KQX54_010051 [Cotesia glomerata]
MAPIAVGWRCPTCRRPTYAAQACVRGADAILASHLTLVERVRRAEATLEELLPLAERLNRALAFVKRNPPRTLLPRIPRARALENARVLARELRANPTVPSRSRAGCWNCGMPHNMVMCPYPRGTFCQRCGEIGVYFEECRRCQPECPIDGPRRQYHEVSVVGTLPNNANLIIKKRPKQSSKIINSNQTSLGKHKIDKAPQNSAKIVTSVKASLGKRQIDKALQKSAKIVTLVKASLGTSQIDKAPKDSAKIITSVEASLGKCQIDKAPQNSAKIITSIKANLGTCQIDKAPHNSAKIVTSVKASLGTSQIDKAPKYPAKIITSVDASLETKQIENSPKDFSEVTKPDQGSLSENKIIECDGKRFMGIDNDGHGNCLFYSLAYLKTGNANEDRFFRNEIVQYAVDNWSDVKDILESSSTTVKYINVQDYATKMGSEGCLGTDFEIGNFAKKFQTNVKLVILDNNKKLDESDIIPLVGSDVPNDPFIYIAFSGKRDDGHFEAMEEIKEVRKRTVEISPTNEKCCETDSSK